MQSQEQQSKKSPVKIWLNRALAVGVSYPGSAPVFYPLCACSWVVGNNRLYTHWLGHLFSHVAMATNSASFALAHIALVCSMGNPRRGHVVSHRTKNNARTIFPVFSHHADYAGRCLHSSSPPLFALCCIYCTNN